MSGRELDPDGTDSYHPEHPWEQAGDPLYLPPDRRTRANWPPVPAEPAGPTEAATWSRLPKRPKPKIEIITERKQLQVRQPWIRGGTDFIEVDVCAKCSAIVFDPIDHFEWHRKEKR